MARRDPKKDVIDAGTLRVTTASGFGAAIVILVTAINPIFKIVFGVENVKPGVKAAIVIAAIVGWALLAAVDVLARSYATAHAQPQVVPVPGDMTATRTKGTRGDVDESGYGVAALRFDASHPESERTKFLILKADRAPEWVSGSDLNFD